MKSKQANLLQSQWIILRTLWVTLIRSVQTIATCYLNRNPQLQVDAISHKWASELLQIVKLSYQIYNPNHVTLEPNKRYIIMSNHASLYDIPLMFVTFPNSVRMIAKKELFRVPIWGRALRVAGFFSIDRNNFKRAYKDLQGVKDKMQQGIVPWISPEGTRSHNGKLNAFKKGGFILAIETGATIIPVGIRGTAEVLPAKTLNFNTGQCVEIHICPPIETTAYTPDNCRELMNTVAEAIRIAADLPENNIGKELFPLVR